MTPGILAMDPGGVQRRLAVSSRREKRTLLRRLSNRLEGRGLLDANTAEIAGFLASIGPLTTTQRYLPTVVTDLRTAMGGRRYGA